ncbi:unnamed protein product [Protopolystoma xenopodis]|uniref:FYVE-type domain-containing protein n=1 Tax=Protopolystoma xenopodis TaxID=117903 RepID=A0A3S5A1P7_9PLAT|nr:unnamed protein product [Protopolystoma xenopodis]
MQLERLRQQETEVRWLDPDDVTVCFACNIEFPSGPVVSSRKQHCRHCGKIFCTECLQHVVPCGPKSRPASVCSVCHTLLNKNVAPFFSSPSPNAMARTNISMHNNTSQPLLNSSLATGSPQASNPSGSQKPVDSFATQASLPVSTLKPHQHRQHSGDTSSHISEFHPEFPITISSSNSPVYSISLTTQALVNEPNLSPLNSSTQCDQPNYSNVNLTPADDKVSEANIGSSPSDDDEKLLS